MEARRPAPKKPYREEDFDYPLIEVNPVKVNSVKSAKLPHIDVILDGQLLKSLIDTGATVSYVPMSSVTGKVKTTHQPKAIAANGSSINFLGTRKAEIQIEHLIIPHTFLVSIDGECPAPILIGLDLTKKINKTGHEQRDTTIMPGSFKEEEKFDYNDNTDEDMVKWKNVSNAIRLWKKRVKRWSDGKAADLAQWINELGRLMHMVGVKPSMGVSLIPFLSGIPAVE
uniref:Peptidase A2 domain-containing protein n=1 Tax=Caenorhabditis japonica TaxID=281687 RepID=A0A8R1HTV6_CAEJA